jgi:hypothetical protein
LALVFQMKKSRPIHKQASVDNNLLTLLNGLNSFQSRILYKSGHTEYLFDVTIYYMKSSVCRSQEGALCISMAHNPG